MEQRQWIDIEIQESKDPHCFQVSKFITRLLRHSEQVNLEEDAGVSYDQVIEECKKKGIRRYRILVGRNEAAICQFSILVN